ncbi:LysR substrate-binding domain-containing protein [Phenylobacterium sp.]|uniref:LysR substrate-binding domain-containing protein n=1 Tax=Phenylobacterium sp. TaxID=1871053 RepID=UPI002FC8349F
MNLRQLDAFRAVMMTGSITHAAEQLYLSQPAVSRQISDLERSLGFKLFVRTKGSALAATPEASAFFVQVERSYTGIRELARAADDIRNFRSGNLHIACLLALATGFVPSVIKKFRDDYPDVKIHLMTRSSATIRQWVGSQQFDFGIATPSVDVPGLEVETLLRTKGVCVLPQGHPLSAKSVIRPADIGDHPFISLGLEDPARRKLDLIFERAGVERNIVVETSYAVTICGLVREGIGCSILNPLSVDDFAGQGLVVRPFEPTIEFQYMLFMPPARPHSLLASKFIEYLKAEPTSRLPV